MSEVNWSKRMFELAEHIGGWSKDRRTGVGAVITDFDNRIISIGYNGFPSGLDDSVDSRHSPERKLLYTEHAERNAIFNAARTGAKTAGCKMYVQWFPCVDCARAIIQSGIEEIVCKRPDFEHPKWGNSFVVAYEILIECGVRIYYI